jgi:hypothetical protein
LTDRHGLLASNPDQQSWQAVLTGGCGCGQQRRWLQTSGNMPAGFRKSCSIVLNGKSLAASNLRH